MAPRGPNKPNNKNNQKNNQNGKGRQQNNQQNDRKGPALKPKSEGGIKKRRGPANGNPRADKDGDLDMGALGSTAGLNPRTNQNNDNRNDGKGKRNKGTGWVLIRVRGLKESGVANEKNGGVDKLINWIEKKGGERSKGKVNIIKVRRGRRACVS